MRFNAYKSSMSVLIENEAIDFQANFVNNRNKVVKNLSLESLKRRINRLFIFSPSIFIFVNQKKI